MSRAWPARWRDLSALVALVALSVLALSFRLARINESLGGDVDHFYRFAGSMFTGEHFDYYAKVADQPFTYAHLPVFPYLLAPVLWAARQLGKADLHAVKALVYAADLAAGLILYLIARRNGLSRPASLAVSAMWLFSPWVVEAGTGQGHAVSVAAFFALLALLRERVGWQAGLLWALAVATRTEFVFPAAAATVYYGVRRRGQFAPFALSSAAVFAVVVLPYAIRDLGALWWAVFGHLQGRGDGLPSLRGIFHTFGLPYPDFLTGSLEWALRGAAAAALALAAFETDIRRSVLKLGMVFAFALAVVHSRYLVMPWAMALAYASSPGLVWYLVTWYVIEATGLAGDAIWLAWLVVLLALYLVPPLRAAFDRLKLGPRKPRAASPDAGGR